MHPKTPNKLLLDPSAASPGPETKTRRQKHNPHPNTALFVNRPTPTKAKSGPKKRSLGPSVINRNKLRFRRQNSAVSLTGSALGWHSGVASLYSDSALLPISASARWTCDGREGDAPISGCAAWVGSLLGVWPGETSTFFLGSASRLNLA